jgi:hypothetical protein
VVTLALLAQIQVLEGAFQIEKIWLAAFLFSPTLYRSPIYLHLEVSRDTSFSLR